jgi:lipopolysaccharide/colanic/teichoic acid biosynthesis glycosyltransferase
MATQRRSLTDRRPSLAEREAGAIAQDAAAALERSAEPGFLRLETPDSRPIYNACKRVFDIGFASLALLGALPFMLFIAVLIKLDSKGPVFFRQERLGKGTKRFMMLKFRSMRTDCDFISDDLAAGNEATGPLFKMRNDPRITRAGRLLRRTSLDELPQILNVLLGDMSIVGPRPPLPRELAGFENVQRQRLQVKPGLAGLWQVSGRSNLTFNEMVSLDLEYIDNRGFFYDLALIVRTIPAVLLGRGAY